MANHIKNRFAEIFVTSIFVFFVIWWIIIQIARSDAFPLLHTNYDLLVALFGSLYAILALVGGISGLITANKWGGWRSLLGRCLIVFSSGLLAQVFGQIAYTYYIYVLHQDVPYPSLGDIGYFGSIPLYIYGTLLLAKASAVHIGIRSLKNKIQAVLIPLLLLAICYVLFLQNYTFDWTRPLAIFLDFAYPMGQAIYISIAILVYLLSRNILGGLMKKGILFIIFALFTQYSADYIFLYKVSRNMWTVGGFSELMYVIAYFLMSISLLQFNNYYKKLRVSEKK